MPPSAQMRSLTLHASALNDAEYDLYTASLRDLVDNEDVPDNISLDDAHYAQLSISVREVRAWLRGRYNDLPVQQIDSILRTIAQGQTLGGGQFFAIMRLITHARNGKDPDPSLVFIQAHPPASSPTEPHRSPPPQHTELSRTNSNSLKRASQPLPARPSNNAPPIIPPKPTNPFLNRSKSQDAPSAPNSLTTPRLRTATTTLETVNKQPPLPPRKPQPPPPPPPPRHASFNASNLSTPSGKTNVLIQQSLQANRVAQSLKKAEERLQQERVLEVLKTSSGTKQRTSRSTSPTKDLKHGSALDSSVSSVSGSSSSRHSDRPALPPRRRASPSLSTTSWEQVATASITPSHPRSKLASPFFSANANGQLSQSPFQSPGRSPPKVPADLEPDSLPLGMSHLPSIPTAPQPPPMHPDRKPTVSLDGGQDQMASSLSSLPPSPSSANSTRLFRSKSMHHAMPPPVPPPIRSKKRPESVQITSDLGISGTDGRTSSLSSPLPNTLPPPPLSPHAHTTLSRHLSLSSSGSRPQGRSREHSRDQSTSMSDSPLGSLGSVQRALSQLQQKAQPTLDRARYKAEAGLSKRGFVSHDKQRWLRREGEEPLMDSEDGAEGERLGSGGAGGEWERREAFDDEDDDFEEFERVRRSGGREGDGESSGEEGEDVWDARTRNGARKELGSREWMYERDGMKLPAGEGWKAL